MNIGKFKSFLDSVCVKNVVVMFQSESVEKFCSVVNCQFGVEDYDLCCSKFIKKFSSDTQTKWVSFRKGGAKYIYRHIYVCYLSKRNKTKVLKRTAKQIYCKAKIDFKWTYVNKFSCNFDDNSKNRICNVRIDFDHSHDLSPEKAGSLSSGVEEDEKFGYSYFRSEISLIDAKILDEGPLATHEKDDSAITSLTNAQTNPSVRQVINPHNFLEKARHEPVEGTLQGLLVKKQELEKNGYYLSIKDETLDVAVITPIMKRVFEEFSTRDSVVFIESMDSLSTNEGSGAKNDLSVTFAFVSSKIGALPVACVLQTSHNFQISLSLLKVSLERVSGSLFNPRVVVTNGSTIQIIALKTIFPKSKILLSVSHIRQNAWKWLSDPANNVPVDDKKPIMKKFQKVLLAPSIDVANTAFKELFKVLSSKVKDNLRAINYFESWWSRKNEMALQFHSHEIVPEDIDIDDCDESIRMLKSTLLHKTKGFSNLTLLDLVCNVIEDYYHRRLGYFASGRYDRVTNHFSEFCRTVPDAVIMESSKGEYKLRCGQHLYTVNTDLSVCDCTVSREGLYCEHLATTEHKFNLWSVKQPAVLSENERAVIAKIVFKTEQSDGCRKTTQVLDFEYVDVKNKPEEHCTKSLGSGEMKYKLDEDFGGNSENADASIKLDEDCKDYKESEMEYKIVDCTGSLEVNYTPYDDLIGCSEMTGVKIEPDEYISEHNINAEEATCSNSDLGEETCIQKEAVDVMNNQEIFSNIGKELNRVADLFDSSDTGSASASALLKLYQLLQNVRTSEEAHQLVVSIAQKNS